MTLVDVLLMVISGGVTLLILTVIICIGLGLLALAVTALCCFFHFLVVKLINWFENAEEALGEVYVEDVKGQRKRHFKS